MKEVIWSEDQTVENKEKLFWNGRKAGLMEKIGL